MPCYRCGARQNDPVRGVSAWRRGVRADEQVLICPDCQVATDWSAELDRCGRCGSTALMRRLGRTVCRDCEAASAGMAPGQGASVQAIVDDGTNGEVTNAVESDLAQEVAAAIDRILGRSR